MFPPAYYFKLLFKKVIKGNNYKFTQRIYEFIWNFMFHLHTYICASHSAYKINM